MSRTEEEKQAIVEDIAKGVQHIIMQLRGAEKAMPIAVNMLEPHGAATRRLLKATAELTIARESFEAIHLSQLKVKDSK